MRVCVEKLQYMKYIRNTYFPDAAE